MGAKRKPPTDHDRELRVIDGAYGLVLYAAGDLEAKGRGWALWNTPAIQAAAMAAARAYDDAISKIVATDI